MKVIVTEDQYLGDIASLFRRYRLAPGSAGSLELLAGELRSNPALRGDLFNLCTAISHMGETDLSPEEMLQLAARAMSGTNSVRRSGEPPIPASLHGVFIEEYIRWINRDSEQNSQASPDTEQSSQQGHGLSPSATPFAAAASLSDTERRRSDRRRHDPQIRPDTPIGDLTISQLRGYLDEIESRVGRLQPYLESLRDSVPEPTPFSSAAVPSGDETAAPRQSIEPSTVEQASAHDPMLFHRGRAPRPEPTPDLPPASSVKEQTYPDRLRPAPVSSPSKLVREPAETAIAAPAGSDAASLTRHNGVKSRRPRTESPIVNPAGRTNSPDIEKADADEPEPVVLLPVRGSAPRHEPGRYPAVDSETSPEPVLFHNLVEPESHRSRYALGIGASLLLITLCGEAGYHHFYQSAVAPNRSTPPALVEPASGPVEQVAPEQQDQLPPTTAPAPYPQPAQKPAATTIHRPRANSRAVQVEAEAARSEVENSSPDSDRQPTSGSTDAGQRPAQRPVQPSDQPQ